MKESTEMVLFGSDHRHGFNRQLFVLLLVLVALGTLMSSSHARPVKEVSVVGATDQKGFAVEGESNSLSLKKEAVDCVGKASDELGETSGRSEEMMKSGGDGMGKWKENYMAFSADYRSPKPHPPRNN
ncbi:uncharacterized protein LOC105158121 [Sesamum indicum]|uniref:Uncharacterized protein LOC105158121 n=1 Tax=Sesamum indicum TaxID=4182 RepID=A0A8M8UP39_SESIN|nr:uncharacterized protein LOC105158121 [Sesamum indicum]